MLRTFQMPLVCSYTQLLKYIMNRYYSLNSVCDYVELASILKNRSSNFRGFTVIENIIIKAGMCPVLYSSKVIKTFHSNEQRWISSAKNKLAFYTTKLSNLLREAE